MDSQLLDERTIALDTTTGSIVLVEGYDKRLLERDPRHKNILTSLVRFANYYAKRGITAKLQTPEPTSQSNVQRAGYTGLKEVQKFVVANNINEIAVREFYREDSPATVIFVTMDTSPTEYKKTTIGLTLILKSLKITKQ